MRFGSLCYLIVATLLFLPFNKSTIWCRLMLCSNKSLENDSIKLLMHNSKLFKIFLVYFLTPILYNTLEKIILFCTKQCKYFVSCYGWAREQDPATHPNSAGRFRIALELCSTSYFGKILQAPAEILAIQEKMNAPFPLLQELLTEMSFSTLSCDCLRDTV